MSAPPTAQEADDFAARMEALGALIEEIERSCAPQAVAPARELLRALLAVQESGLRALLAALRSAAGPEAETWLAAACQDPQVSALLQMHDLQPMPEAAAPAPAQKQPEKLIPASRLIARIGGAQR